MLVASKRPEQTIVFPGKQTAMRTVAKGADLSKLHLHVSLAGSSTVQPSTTQCKGHIKEARLQNKPYRFKRWLAWRQAAIRPIETVCHAYDCASLRRLIRMPLVQPWRIPLTYASDPTLCHLSSQLQMLFKVV